MAYALKYYFPFESAAGHAYTIEILQDGFTGTAQRKKLGGAPSFRQETAGPICGSSLQFYAQSDVDGEFADLYTTSPTTFMVRLLDRTNSTTVWLGYITPELYSEPVIAPPYDVQVTATDCLGELKLHTFAGMGFSMMADALALCLSYTGYSLQVQYLSTMTQGSDSNYPFLASYTNLDGFKGKSMYELLEALLATIHGQIRQFNGAWLVTRETDISSCFQTVTVSKGGVSADRSVTPKILNNLARAKIYAWKIDSADKSTLWPVGQLSQSVIPAKKSMQIDAPSDWQAAQLPYVTSIAGNRIVFDTAVDRDLRILYPVRGFTNAETPTLQNVTVKVITGGKPYYLTAPSGGSLQETRTSFSLSGGSYHTWTDVEIFIPSGIFSAGVTQIDVTAGQGYYGDWDEDNVRVKSADEFDGWDIVLTLNNNARGEADAEKIAVSGSSDLEDVYHFHRNAIFEDKNREHPGSAASTNIAAMSLLRFLGRDYALSIATPRLKVEGKLNWPKGLTPTALLFKLGSLYYLVDEYSVDLLNDEMDIAMSSLPAASLNVASETIIIEGQGATAPLATITTPTSFINIAKSYVDKLPIYVLDDTQPGDSFDWWMTTSTAWITIKTGTAAATLNSGMSGLFTVAANNTGAERTGTITVHQRTRSEAGQSEVTVDVPVTQMG